MVSYTQEITLDINTNTAYQVVSAKQGDTGSRWILVHLTKDNIPYQATPGNNAQFRCRKPDGHAVINPAIINNDGTITVELTAQCLAYPGRAYADVVESDGEGNVLSSVSFILLIMAAPDVASTATSSDEFQKLNELVARSDELISEAEAWARGTKNNQDTGTGNYEEDTNVTTENFNNKKAHLYIKVDDAYVALDPSATFDSSETYYGLSAGLDNNAKYYAEQAEEAKNAIEDLTVSSTTLAAGTAASAIKTVDQQTGIVNIEFGIPQGIQGVPGQDGVDGERGPSTVWVGAAAPTDPDYTVWLNPEGTEIPLLVTADQVSYASSATYSAHTIGYAMASVEESMGYINTVASEAEAAANRAEAAAEELEQVIVEINGKITNPALPTNNGLLSVSVIHPLDPTQPAIASYAWKEKISYSNDIENLPKINNQTVVGSLTLSQLGIAPRTGSTVYYTFPSTGIPSTDLANAVNSSLNLADSAVQTIKMNNLDFEPSDGVVNLGTILTDAYNGVEVIHANNTDFTPIDGVVNLGTILTIEDNTSVVKNYLDNAWFTINQKGITSYNGDSDNEAVTGTYICDRWKIINDQGDGNRSISISDEILNISVASTPNAANLFDLGQIINDDAWKAIGGRQVTASINFSSDGIDYVTKYFNFECPAYGMSSQDVYKYQIIENSGWGIAVKTITVSEKNYLVFSIIWGGNIWGNQVSDNPIYVNKTKLELGIISTLNIEGKPIYEDELKKCQKYYRYYGGKEYKENNTNDILVLGQGIAATTTLLDWVIPIDMISKPTITSSVNLVARRGIIATTASVGTVNSSALASATVFESINDLYVEVAATNLTASAAYIISLPATTSDGPIAYIEFNSAP